MGNEQKRVLDYESGLVVVDMDFEEHFRIRGDAVNITDDTIFPIGTPCHLNDSKWYNRNTRSQLYHRLPNNRLEEVPMTLHQHRICH